MSEVVAKPSPRDVDRVIVRPYPKIVFLYPVFLFALLCGILQSLSAGEGAQRTLGLIFFVVAAVNLLVFSFEFSRTTSVALLLGILALVFLVLWLGHHFPVLKAIKEFVVNRNLWLSTEAYFGIAIYLGLIFGGVFLNTRINYYEVKHNEILHHTGFLGSVRRFPSPSLRMTKEISDVFEYFLLLSGKIVLYPASEKEAIVLENVIGINRIEKKVQVLLGTLQVEIDRSGGGGDDE
ncbi:MAG: hypothetical protein JXP34_28420 [Planctomycetes bacterium]|nr:hypothetical protein [Planctomycetota bacterium]